LAKVLRNGVFKARRTDGRRGAREAAMGGGVVTAAQSPEQLLEAVDAQRLLSEALAALAEPYRTTVLLRYYEGIEPGAIAARLEVPAGTVRWRLSEGLSLLRKSLAEREGGRVGGWQRALLPLMTDVSVPRVPPPTAGSVSTGVVALGVGAASIGVLTLAWQSGRPEANPLAPMTMAERRESPSLRKAPPDPDAQGSLPLPAREVSDNSTAAERVPSPRASARGRVPAFVAGRENLPNESDDESPSPRKSVDKELIRRAVREVMPAIKGCYEKLLLEDPRASGRMVVSMRLVAKDNVGRIEHATIKPQTHEDGTAELISATTELCILKALIAAPFPSPVDDSVVEFDYPFRFDPG
jgi:hypothetical protein